MIMSKYLSQDKINEKKLQLEWRIKQCFAPFGEAYPNVLSCSITYSRKADGAGGWYGDKTSHTIKVSMFDSSMVTIPCVNSDCTKGYFDLKDIIRDMISHHETDRQGKIVCDGYQDAERIDVHQCLCELKLEKHIEYK